MSRKLVLTAILVSQLALIVAAHQAQADYTLFTVPDSWDAWWIGEPAVKGPTMDTADHWRKDADPSPVGVDPFNVSKFGTLPIKYPNDPAFNNVLIGNGKGTSNTGIVLQDSFNLFLLDDFASGRYATQYPIGFEMIHNGYTPSSYICSGSTVNQAVGTFQINHGSLFIGDSGAGTYNIEGGLLTTSNTATVSAAIPAKSYNIVVGSSESTPSAAGTGTLNIAGTGAVTIPAANSTYGGGKLIIGNLSGGNPFSSGTVNMTGGTLTAPEINIVNGAFNHSAGTIKADLLTIEANGKYTNTTETTLVIDSQNIKQIDVNGGAFNVTKTIDLGSSGTGTLNFNANNASDLTNGYSIPGTLSIGRSGSQTGNVSVLNGAIVKQTGSYLFVGQSGQGNLTIKNDNFDAVQNNYSSLTASSIYIGDVKNSGATGQITVGKGGKLTTGQLWIADKDGTSGTVDVLADSIVDVTGETRVGYSQHWGDAGATHNDGGNAILNISGGTFNAKGQTQIGKTSQLNVNFGSYTGTGAAVIYGTSQINVGGDVATPATLDFKSTFKAYTDSVTTVKSNGTMNFSANAVFGDSAKFVVNNGTITLTGILIDIVLAETSSMTVTGADSNIDLDYRVKFSDQSTGTISAGTFHTDNDFVVGYTQTPAVAGTATLDVTGGTVSVDQTLVLGVHATSGAKLTVGGTAESPAAISALAVKIGEKSTGETTGGVLTSGGSVLQLNANGSLAGGTDLFTIGHEANSAGELILNGGTVSTSSSNGIYVGLNGNGILSKIDSGTTTIGTTLRLGAETGSTGTLNVFNGTLKITGNYLLNGIKGNGNINIIGGTLDAKQLYLGDSAAAQTSHVTVAANAEGRAGVLKAGQLWIADKNKTTGFVDVQDGGTATITGATRIGFSQHFIDANANHIGGNGELKLSGGTYNAKGVTQIGQAGKLWVTAGTYTGTGDLTMIGTVDGSGSTSFGTILLDGADANLVLNGNVSLIGNCQMNLNNGTFDAKAVGTSVIVGANSLTVNSFREVAGESQINIDGATVNIETLNIGVAGSDHTGKVSLKSGTLNVGTINIVDNQGTFNMTGGTLNVGTSTAPITQKGGFMSPGGDTVAAQSVLTGDYSMVDAAIIFNADHLDQLDSSWNYVAGNDFVTEGATGDATFNVSGRITMSPTESLLASLEIGDQIVLAQASDIAIGEGGLTVNGPLPDVPDLKWGYGLTTIEGKDYLYAEVQIPEPSTWALLIVGLSLGGLFFRKRTEKLV